eukprot:2394818-Rhodomonas_salina.1
MLLCQAPMLSSYAKAPTQAPMLLCSAAYAYASSYSTVMSYIMICTTRLQALQIIRVEALALYRTALHAADALPQ